MRRFGLLVAASALFAGAAAAQTVTNPAPASPSVAEANSRLQALKGQIFYGMAGDFHKVLQFHVSGGKVTMDTYNGRDSARFASATKPMDGMEPSLNIPLRVTPTANGLRLETGNSKAYSLDVIGDSITGSNGGFALSMVKSPDSPSPPPMAASLPSDAGKSTAVSFLSTFKITPSDRDVPPAIAAFSGKWEGATDSGHQRVMVIEHVTAGGGASVTHAWSDASRPEGFKPFRYSGKIANGALSFSGGRDRYEFTMASDGTLRGVLLHDNARDVGADVVMTHVP